MNRLLLPFLFLAACGDNSTSASVDSGPPDAYVPEMRAVAVAGDFGSPGTGVISRLDIDTLAMQPNVVQSVVQGDPALRQIGDEIFVINRFGSNNITILDAKTLQLVEQIGTGASSNPQDVAVVGNKLYVPAMGTKGVLVLTRGSTTMKEIDLSALETKNQAGDTPDCISAYAVGTKVYVACAVLDGFNTVEAGKIAVIDATTDTLVTSAAMTYGNPYGFLERAPEGSVYAGDLLIPTVPSFNDYATGCLERVSTGATPQVTCGLTNAQLGGFVNRAAIAPDGGLLYLAVFAYDAMFNESGSLKGFDLGSGTLWPSPVSAMTQLIADVTVCPNGDVVATDKTLNAGGLRVWRDTVERTTMPLPIGMPPKSVNALACYDAAK